MSAWVLGLALAAGYLVNKNITMQNRLAEKAHEFQQNAQPATPLPSSEIRQVQRTVPLEEKFQDVNLAKLGKQRVQEIGAASDRASAEVASFEAAPFEIQGVYLRHDNFGV